ncbi:hypothetical protein MTR67_039157 [Solanum verrucosum]|uniref:Uncharacterized protein n=1 Tax=Solanum verrucosum TaxID=315347 RepID=A0AAF0UGQ7_SOLVR|nr:hypothetical protein MTR67_039157 [Solanum verrucosum]
MGRPGSKTGQDQQYQPNTQSGKTLNSTISTHNNYNDLVVQDRTNSQEPLWEDLVYYNRRQGKTNNISLRNSQPRRTRKSSSEFDTSIKEIHKQTKSQLEKVEGNTVERF